MKTIYLAGGCFWGCEAYFKQLKGVEETQVGYANGNLPSPSYSDLKEGRASQAETVKIIYDEKVISLSKLLEHLLRFIDPYAVDRQGFDFGHQYRTGVFYLDEEDRREIVSYLKKREKEAGKGKFAIEVKRLDNYYPAEEYHQDYLEKNPGGYCHVNLRLARPEEKK
jgi:methionine-S-sulfoxide reductase